MFISDSMQDMLDLDIRAEVATVVGGSNHEFSLLQDMQSPLELDINRTTVIEDVNLSSLGDPKWPSNDIYSDMGTCVNPSSITPVITSSILTSPKSHLNLNTITYSNNSTSPLPSPKEKKSHLTFSPNTLKVGSNIDNRRYQDMFQQIHESHRGIMGTDAVKKDLNDIMSKDDNKFIMQNAMINSPSSQPINTNGNTVSIQSGIGGLRFTSFKKNNQSNQRVGSPQMIQQLKRNRDTPSPLSINTSVGSPASQPSPKIVGRMMVNNSKTVNGQLTMSKAKAKSVPNGVSEFPKPAYSYSCLIAMALKNSRAGSLPVSEIYSFMCEHFPYFKTAPNGWKNSVRHNLSLNKCFEKIEKPATNGGQRKGCLWAMNPSKIAKMDEEVQKWSRKDPMSIKRAMVIPENLEALERGEMKHGSSGDSETEDTEEDSEPGDSFINPAGESGEDEDSENQIDYDIEVKIKKLKSLIGNDNIYR